MRITRREFLTYTAATGAAIGITESGLLKLEQAMAAEGAPPVVWVQAATCTGCSVSLLNSIYYTTIDDLLLRKIDLRYHPNVSAAAGDLAVQAISAHLNTSGHILVVEGAIPTGNGGKYCYLWKDMTALSGIPALAKNAAYVIACGTCASFGGVSAGKPNPTAAVSVSTLLGAGMTSKIVNIPGCPIHPDWIVGTIATLLTYGRLPELDSNRRPKVYYEKRVHEQCPRKEYFEDGPWATAFGQSGCLRKLGCTGPETSADCPKRKWNSPAVGQYGVNWCIQANTPCHGCVAPDFPDGKSPFFIARQTDDDEGEERSGTSSTSTSGTRRERDDD